MNSYFAKLQYHIVFNAKVVRAMMVWLVMQFSVAAPSTFAVEENAQTEQTRAVLHNSIAVMPFENLSSDPNDAYFAAGIHVEIINQLTKIQDLSVISNTGIVVYGDRKAVIAGKERYPSDMPITEVASKLNIETVMKGRVRYANDRINIAVQLFDASGNQLWSEKYERDLSDIFMVQAEIVEHIAVTVGAKVSTTETKRIAKVPTHSLEAYVLYLKARVLVSHIETGMPTLFYQYLDQAIALDPNFALAHAIKATSYGLAHSFGNLVTLMSLDDVEKVAATHTDRAMALDPNLYFANMAQALIHFIRGRHLEAEQVFERALQLGPSSVEVLNSYSHFLSFNGKDDKAIQLSERAQMLTPNDASFHARLSMPLLYANKPIEAAKHFRQGLKYHEYHWLHRLLGMAEYLSGNNAEALKEVRIAEKMLADTGRGPDALAAYTYSLLGYQDDATRLVNAIEAKVVAGQFITPVNWTYANLAIGKYDSAFEILNQDVNSGLVQLQYLKHNIMNDPALEEPRFVELRNRIGSRPEPQS